MGSDLIGLTNFFSDLKLNAFGVGTKLAALLANLILVTYSHMTLLAIKLVE